MTTAEAVIRWKEMKAGITPEALRNKDKHALVHEIFEAINRARLSGEMTYEQIAAI